MSSSVAGEVDNSALQKQISKVILKSLNSKPNQSLTPTEVYEYYFEPAASTCSEELVAYVIERMIRHEDGIVSRSDGESNCIEVEGARVRDYIKTHLATPGDPFPDVDPEPFFES